MGEHIDQQVKPRNRGHGGRGQYSKPAGHSALILSHLPMGSGTPPNLVCGR